MVAKLALANQYRHQYVRCCLAVLGEQTTHNAKTDISIVSFVGVYGSKFTKFSTLVDHHGDCLPWKFDGGYSRKFWENRQKPGIFALVHAKARTVFTSGGQRSRSNVHFVGHCLSVPRPFQAFRNSLPFRRYKLRTVGTDSDLSRFFSF